MPRLQPAPPTVKTVLGTRLRKAREAKGWSINELARRSGLDKSRVSRLEAGLTTKPVPSTLDQLARVLDIEAATLQQAAGYVSKRTMPSLPVYFRSKYGNLPDEAMADLERYVERLRQKHGLPGSQPKRITKSTKRSTKGGKP